MREREQSGEKGETVKERRLDVEISEDERRRTRIGSLKKKALSASTKFTHSLKKQGETEGQFQGSFSCDREYKGC